MERPGFLTTMPCPMSMTSSDDCALPSPAFLLPPPPSKLKHGAKILDNAQDGDKAARPWQVFSSNGFGRLITIEKIC